MASSKMNVNISAETRDDESFVHDINDDHLIPEIKLDEEFSPSEDMEYSSDSETMEDIPLSLRKIRTTFKSDTIKSYPCSYCAFVGKLRRELRDHLRIHKEHPFKCPVCGVACSNNGNLKRHMLIHTGELPYQCSLCDLSFKTKTLLKIHILKHTGERPHKCKECPASFTQGSHLKKHMGIHEREKKKQFNCAFCRFVALAQKDLLKHHLEHTIKSESGYQCRICEYSCQSCENIQQHLQKHADERSLKCATCGKAFKSNRDLARHVALTHHNKRILKCPHCEYNTKLGTHLKKHLQLHEESRLVCSLCNLKCFNEEVLKEHILEHKSEKIYNCKICSYKSAEKYRLNAHLMTHDRITPYCCELCGYSAATIDHIKRHMIVHTREQWCP